MLSLVAGENVSGFDIKLHYDNPQPTPVITAESVSYAGNIFGQVLDNFVSQACIPGGTGNPNIQCNTSDPSDYTPGWVHFSALANSGNPVPGPRPAALLFSINFAVNKNIKASSLIRIVTANVGNSGSGSFATTRFIPITTEDGIFSNSGVTAFFNYLPTDTPSVVTGHPNTFDASGSFNADNSSIHITRYSWNFDDGTTNTTANSVISHRFWSVRSYNVTLTVIDAKGGANSTHRIVVVGPALGALILSVYSLQKVPQSGVLVKISNSSSTFPFANATTDTSGQVTFRNLSPGTYTLAFSGQYVKNSTATETIIAGWTTQDGVGIEVDTPAPPGPTPWYGGIVFLASLGGAMGLFGLGLFVRRRNARKKLRSARAGLGKK